MNRSIIQSLGFGALALSLAAGTSQASLFLDSWGVSYGSWNATVPAPMELTYTVEDWTSGGGGYLDPGWGGDGYDAEAAYMGTDGSYLYVAVVTGFPLAGRDGFAAGDIALDINGDRSDAHDYDFAIDTDAGGALRSGNMVWEDPDLGGGSAWGGASDPLRVTSWDNSTAISQFSYSSWQGRYAIEAVIDLGDLGPADSYELHWTMGCGNDVIEMPFRPTDPVPEPASLLLLGSGLGLAGVMARRRKTRPANEA